MTRHLRALVLILALGLTAFISSTLTSIQDRDAPDPRPLPVLVADLSSTAATAQQQFTERVRTKFPLGTPERVLLLELWSEGFEHPGDGPKPWASLERHGPPCTRNWTVTWASDDTGHLTAIDGTYVPSC